MTAVTKWTPPARTPGAPARRSVGGAAFRDGGLLPAAALGLALVAGVAVGHVLVVLALVAVPTCATGIAIRVIARRAQARPPWPAVAVEGDSPRPQAPSSAQLAAMTTVAVEVVTPVALEAARPVADPLAGYAWEVA